MNKDRCLPPIRCPAGPQKPPRGPATPGTPQGPLYSGFLIVRLVPDLGAAEEKTLTSLARRHKLEGLLNLLNDTGMHQSWPLIRSLRRKELLALERRASRSAFPLGNSLSAYWRIDLRDRPDEAQQRLERLQQLPVVELAYRELSVSDPMPVDDSDDPFADQQDYLDPAPEGIDARWAWTQPNGTGAGTGVVDLEQGWFLSHEDLVGHGPSLIYGDNRDGVGTYVGNHGTAVLGQIVGEDNTLGIVGIAPELASVRVTSHFDGATNTALNVADALVAALPTTAVGDVILLEVQRGGGTPTETDAADFDAIRLATALGVIVVQAAGNGSNNLDTLTDAGGNQFLNRGSADFRDSGAIMVGAALSALPHDRAGFSNFGSRIDCYGWGNNITTCGYGDLDDGGGDNDRTYTATFGGTSGASPMVTGAALILQGMYEANTGTRLSPGQMRAILADPVTGTPQGGTVAGNIGVMPDLRAIIEDTLGLVADVYLRDNLADTGAIPSTGAISASPDVILRQSEVADPNAAFGEGSGTGNDQTLGFEAQADSDNFIYVRMRNRGAANADDVTATVHWSPVATLLTPELWTLVGTSSPVDVPTGDTLVVTDAIVWPADEVPAPGHYCLVALLDHDQDPAPPLPPGPPEFDWDAFRGFIRAHNNVTWRNFNVVAPPPDPDEPLALPFLIMGTPDRSRVFDFEVVARLPQGARLRLSVPRSLANRLRGDALWPMEEEKDRDQVLMRLPSLQRLPLCGIQLGKGARIPARFLMQVQQGIDLEGASVTIRQLYDGEEVGRVTWQVASRRVPG
ncbi:MAG: S8 family peptidase [Oleiphilaceae bacterium]|nr:S8 family peptidase [Oleiphilaceae bacterium]